MTDKIELYTEAQKGGSHVVSAIIKKLKYLEYCDNKIIDTKKEPIYFTRNVQ